MEFKLFRDEMLKHFNEKLSSRSILFRTNIDRDKIWEVYLNSFPEEGGVGSRIIAIHVSPSYVNGEI